MSLTRSTAVVIGLTPSFAVLVRAGQNAIRKPDADEQEVQLTTIGGSGGSRNRKENPNPSETWLAMDYSREELATAHDAASVTTSVHLEEGSLGLRR